MGKLNSSSHISKKVRFICNMYVQLNRVDGWMGGWVGGWMDGWIGPSVVIRDWQTDGWVGG